jgi:hypothetical protein
MDPMKTDKLIEQLELYSNAVVGFMVAQSIGFSFTFGTNADFGCEIVKYKSLSIALAAHFVLSTIMAAWSLRFLQHRIFKLSGENEDTLRFTYRAKVAVVVLFAVIPVGLLLSFGLFGDVTKGRCAKLVTADVLVDAAFTLSDTRVGLVSLAPYRASNVRASSV